MYSIKNQLVSLFCVLLLVAGCNKDEQNVTPTDDNEAITTATLVLTNKATPTESVTATVENLNTTADSSKATLNLKANTTYTGNTAR